MKVAKAAGEYDALATDRWLTLTVGVNQFDGQPDNSDLIQAWLSSTREILGRMVHGAESEDEYELLGHAESRVHEALEEAATKLVAAVETQRKAAAA